MILVDFNGAMIGKIISQKMDKDIDELRVFILNELREYNLKFREKFAHADDTRMVVCLEGKSWRKSAYPQYKANRAKPSKIKIDWDFVYSSINEIVDELRVNSPYIFVQHPEAEADDVIAAMVNYKQQFGQGEDVMIVSSDSDFKQLHKFKNVYQFSVLHHKMIPRETDPKGWLIEHILRGQSKDGIPNIYSPDDQFTDPKGRQKAVTQSMIDAFKEDIVGFSAELTEEQQQHFLRNAKMMDLQLCPSYIHEAIVDTYEGLNNNRTEKGKLMPYLISKRHRLLVECIEDFL